MSQQLQPCPACQRHVFADACDCPFCGAKLSPESCVRPASPPPDHRGMSRAARVAAGATLLGAAACFTTGSFAYGSPPYVAPDAAADGAQDAAGDGSPGGRGGGGAGGQGGQGGAGQGGQGGQGGRPSPIGTGGAPVYGSPPGTGGDRGVTPLDGGATPDAGTTKG